MDFELDILVARTLHRERLRQAERAARLLAAIGLPETPTPLPAPTSRRRRLAAWWRPRPPTEARCDVKAGG